VVGLASFHRFVAQAVQPAASTVVSTLLFLIATTAFAADWIRVSTPHAEIFTDAGEKSAADLTTRFERMDAVFHDAGISGTAMPVRTFVFANEADFRRYRDDRASAGFYKGGERDYIAFYSSPDTRRVAMHEYVHMVLRRSSIALPHWFEEGTSDFYSTAEFQGANIRLGERIDGLLYSLLHDKPLAAPQLNSKPPATKPSLTMYYAESWALVHMLNLAPSWAQASNGGMPKFILELAAGRDSDTAFRNAFGKSMDDAIAALPAYLDAMRAVTIAIAPFDPPKPTVEKLSPLDSALAHADLALHVEKPNLARELIETVAKKQPASPAIVSKLAMIELAAGNRDRARAAFNQAVMLGSSDAEMWFQHANLEREFGASREKFSEMLAKVIELDPNFADARFLLAQQMIDAGKPADAIAQMEIAVKLRPRESQYWYTLGFAQARAGRHDDAISSARHAAATADTDQTEAMATALARMANEPTQRPPGSRPAVVTPPGWFNTQGESRVEGTLTKVDCLEGIARLHVRNGATDVILEVRHPDKVVLDNAGGVATTLHCGEQKVPVLVEYLAATSEVTRIEFR
jgi:tetratricopeptide (TPR) repeat protein